VIFGIVTKIIANVDVVYCLQVSWNVSSVISNLMQFGYWSFTERIICSTQIFDLSSCDL